MINRNAIAIQGVGYARGTLARQGFYWTEVPKSIGKRIPSIMPKYLLVYPRFVIH
jgi:hypothetical protein